MEYKKQIKSLDSAFYSSSAALQAEDHFYDDEDSFVVFQNNLVNLEKKVARLDFMMNEIHSVLSLSRFSK